MKINTNDKNKTKGKFKYNKSRTNGQNIKNERSVNNNEKMLKMKDVLDEIQKETELIQKGKSTKKEKNNDNMQVVSTINYSIMNIKKKLFCKCLPLCKSNKIIK